MPRTGAFYASERISPVEQRITGEYDRRRRMLEALMSHEQRPIRTVTGGVAQMLEKGLQGLAQGRLRKQEEERRGAAQDTITRALMGEQVNPAQGPPRDLGGGVTSQPISRTPNNMEQMAAILAGNPDTAGMGMDMRMQDMARQQQLADEQRRASQEQATWQSRFDAQQQAQQAAQQRQFQQQMQMRQTPQATAPIPGRDVPLPQEVLDQRIAMEQARVQATASAKGQQLSPGQKKIDETAAKDLAPFVVGGGFADTQKNLEQLRNVEAELEKGGVTGTFVGLTPDFALAPFNQRAVDTQNQVEEVVQRNLRTILGAQFTEKEGQRLIARAYNPHLGEKVNLRRVRALRESIEAAAQAKQEAWDYMQKNGTLKGFSGKLWGVQDFYRAIDGADGEDSKSGSGRFKLKGVR